MREFEGRTAVVTGAASGMGLAMARAFAAEGMSVVLADVEEEALRDAAAAVADLGAAVLPVATDVGSAADMDHLGEATRERFGAAHVICLNAGVGGGGGPMEGLSVADWKWALDVNLWGVIHGIRVFLPGLKAQDEGHVVITSSVAGLTSYPGSAPYNASKHAAASIAETLYAELADAGSAVGASCLCPGLVATRIHASERNRPKELRGEPVAASDEQLGALRSAMEQLFARGRPPAEVAQLVLEAIVERRFWVYTDERYREPIRARHRAIESGGDPPARGPILAEYGS